MALDKVYGPSPPGEEWHPDAVWRERYAIPPNQQKRFRKWFREQYGD